MIGLGPHVMAGPGSLTDFLAATKVAVIKYVDPPDHPVLAPLTVGRIFEISDQKDLSNPKALAVAHADAISKRADATGIKVWEGINELYKIWEDPELCKRFQDYELERMRLLHTRGLSSAVLCVNTGWPGELPNHTIDWSGVDTLMKAFGPNDLVDIHEYFRKDGPRGSAYLNEVGRFFRCPYRNVKFFTSECGIDVGGGQDDGFLGQGVTPSQYAAMLIDFRNICATDSRWVGGTPFTFGHFAGGQWKNFDWEPYWREFIGAMTSIATITDTIRILEKDGTVTVMELEEYLRGVLPAEMYADWPQEALMAGAVAARSYAMALRALNRPTWDVTTTTSTQVYDPSMIRPSTDQAVLATKGLHLIKDSKICMSEYKAMCGRNDCLYCSHESLVKAWPGQMCQWGAWEMSKKGATFREILHHYYVDVRISDEPVVVPPVVVPPVIVPPVVIPPSGLPKLKLADYSVPKGNNAFGWHYLPQLADTSAAALPAIVALLRRMQSTGAKWVKLITSPGGDIGWERGSTKTGACEMTFCAAIDLGLGVVVRLFNSWKPPYLTPAVQANILHLCHLAGDNKFYVECSNEIDAEAGGSISRSMAEKIVTAICDFIDWCWTATNGQCIPVWPSFGYGGPGYNWFQIAHDLGRGDCLDRCGVAVHNYASANRLYEPFDPEFCAGTPLSQAEYDATPWRYGVGVVGQNPRLLVDINAKRADNARKRALLKTDAELMAAYASGWYTYMWALKQLNDLGHSDTPLLLTETGTRVGEMVDWEPRIDPLLHKERTLAMAADARTNPRIIMTGHWLFIGKMFAPIHYVWEDQCNISPTWDRKYNETMPEGEYKQIKTPGQLPVIDELELHPIKEGRTNMEELKLEKDVRTDAYTMGDGIVKGSRVLIQPAMGLQVGDIVMRAWKIEFKDEKEAALDITTDVKCVDSDGKPMAMVVKMLWPSSRLDGPYDGETKGTVTIEKPISFVNGGGNFKPTQSTDFGPYIITCDGVKSDKVYGFGLPNNRHVKYGITFRKCFYGITDLKEYMPGASPIPPVVVPVPGEVDMVKVKAAVLNAAINHGIEAGRVIPWYPDAAIGKYAIAHKFGLPLARESGGKGDPDPTLPRDVEVEGHTWRWQTWCMNVPFCNVEDYNTIYEAFD